MPLFSPPPLNKTAQQTPVIFLNIKGHKFRSSPECFGFKKGVNSEIHLSFGRVKIVKYQSYWSRGGRIFNPKPFPSWFNKTTLNLRSLVTSFKGVGCKFSRSPAITVVLTKRDSRQFTTHFVWLGQASSAVNRR